MDTNCVLIVSNTSSPRLNLQYCAKEIKARFADFCPLFRENSTKIRHEIWLKCPRIFVESNVIWLLSWRNFAFIEANFVLPKFRPEILKYWWSINYWWSMKFGESFPLFGNMESPFVNYYKRSHSSIAYNICVYFRTTLSPLEIIGWKNFRGQRKLDQAVGRVQFGCHRKFLNFWIPLFRNWTSM